MDYEQLLKEFRDTVTAAISNGNVQVTQKLDSVLTRLGELEKSIISLDNHRNSTIEKMAGVIAKNVELEVRLKETEKQILTMQVQGQGLSKVGTALWGVISAIVTGVIMSYIANTKK